MRINWNPSLEAFLGTIPRTHPWSDSAVQQGAQYHDLRRQPELIREVLEDFRILDPYVAGERFYALIEWLNGAGSNFESNDCLLRGPYDVEGRPRLREFRGHLTFFFREAALNAKPEVVAWLCDGLSTGIGKLDDPAESAALDFALWPTLFTAGTEPLLGSALHLRFSATAPSDDKARETLAAIFEGLVAVLSHVSQEFEASETATLGLLKCD